MFLLGNGLLGIFVRVIGAGLAFILITNLFAGFADTSITSDFSSIVRMLQDRLLLTIGALTLFFLGGGWFCLDNL